MITQKLALDVSSFNVSDIKIGVRTHLFMKAQRVKQSLQYGTLPDAMSRDSDYDLTNETTAEQDIAAKVADWPLCWRPYGSYQVQCFDRYRCKQKLHT